MGIGDQIIGSGMARGAALRRKRVAFGDGVRIRWDGNSAQIFKNNPNVAPPGSETSSDLEWVHYYKGNRVYNSQGNGRWIWNYDFKVRPGEMFLDAEEERYALPDNLVVVEPNVPNKKCGPNKQWSVTRFREVVAILQKMGLEVRQFSYGGVNSVVEGVKTVSFRRAVGLLKKARVAVLPEGGLHHAAAAVGCPAVVLFGGFAPPAVLGYDGHVNLTGGADACGSFVKCPHCLEAMGRITPEEVIEAVRKLLCH